MSTSHQLFQTNKTIILHTLEKIGTQSLEDKITHMSHALLVAMSETREELLLTLELISANSPDLTALYIHSKIFTIL